MTTASSSSGIMMIVMLSVVLFSCCLTEGRVSVKMDYTWKFLLHNPNTPCPPNSFPINLNNIQCDGLSQADASNADECQRQCCSDPDCATWQWCPTGAACSPVESCWVGSMGSCNSGKGWVSQGRNVTTPTNGSCDVPYCQPNFDDSSWRGLDIPHDFVVEGTFTPTAEAGHGYLPKGAGWYRKHFTIDATAKGSDIWLYFEGVYRDSTVYINGKFIGTHQSGYTSFYYNVGDVLNYGGSNVIAIEVDARHDEGWWYEGGGIYRHVWLHVADPLHIVQWGVYAPSTVTGTISYPTSGPVASSADVTIYTQVINKYSSTSTFSVKSQIFDVKGVLVGQVTSGGSLASGQNTTLSQKVTLSNVNLWDIASPYLYSLVSTVIDSTGTSVDVVTTRIGIRTIRFDVTNGFYLNERSVKIKGFCNHQDFAGLGIALPRRVNEFRVSKLQEMGANGWRMSHNPPNEELLDITDELGMVVWDENRNFDNNPQYYTDLTILPLRDRNHPSIIIWSLCNEGGCQEGANDTTALQTAQKFKEIIHEYDTSRPISAAWNAGLDDLIYGWGPKVLDLQGINYNYGEIDPYHKFYPAKPLIGSETASCTGARGIYVTNDSAAHRSIFDADGCAREWWTADATRSFMAGGFAWTGFDYKGEPTPYEWPDINSNFGVIDIAGFPKDTFWYYQSWWIQETVLHVFPHWNNPMSSLYQTLQVIPCNPSDKNQNIKFTGSGSTPGSLVTSDGQCLDASCANMTVGCVPLAIKPCDGGAKSQQFVYKSDKSFSSVDNGGCMDLWAFSGPQVGVYACDGGVNQHWDIEGPIIQSTADNFCLTTGVVTPVWIYTNADSAELFVNGVSKGVQKVPILDHAQWSVEWEAGSIKVVAYNTKGVVVGTKIIETTGSPAAVLLEVEVGSDGIYADRQDAALIRASIVDSQGRVVPTASNLITFEVTGVGSLIGVGNGDPSSHEPDKANYRSAFNGLARAIVLAGQKSGTIQIKATSPGLASGSATVNVLNPPHFIPSI